VPELKGWTVSQKQALIQIILAKGSSNESDYLRLLQQHCALKEALMTISDKWMNADSRGKGK